MKLPEAITLCRELAESEGGSRYGDAVRALLAAVEHAGDARTDRSKKDSPEYRTWKAMKARCYNPKFASYATYGGRGILVCAAWSMSFEAFLRDVGPRPSPFHSIDRIDSKGHYEPTNVKWSTRREQSQNRSMVRELDFEGETLCLAEWARRKGMTTGTLESRLRMGWTVEDALTRPVDMGARRKTA